MSDHRQAPRTLSQALVFVVTLAVISCGGSELTFEPDEATRALFRILGLNEAPFDELVATGMDPDTYVHDQCADALRGVDGMAKVYMGVGVDAPRTSAETAKCSRDIVYRSVLATYRAGGHGVVLAPNYASMHLTHLDGAAQALDELGLK